MKKVFGLVLIFLIISSFCFGNMNLIEIFLAGRQAYDEGNYVLASIAFKMVYAFYPDNEVINYWLGKTYEKLNEPVWANYYFNRAEKLNPNEPKYKHRAKSIITF